MALLHDVNEAFNTEFCKFVNTMTSQEVNDILSGKIDIQCDIFRQWRSQSDFSFDFFSLSEFINVTHKGQGLEILRPFVL